MLSKHSTAFSKQHSILLASNRNGSFSSANNLYSVAGETVVQFYLQLISKVHLYRV